MQEYVKALEAQSRRNTARESEEGGVALRLVLSEQGHSCCEAIQLLGFTEKAGLLHKPQPRIETNMFCGKHDWCFIVLVQKQSNIQRRSKVWDVNDFNVFFKEVSYVYGT